MNARTLSTILLGATMLAAIPPAWAGPNATWLSQIESEATLSSLEYQCSDGQGGFSKAACQGNVLADPLPAGTPTTGMAQIQQVSAATDCTQTTISNLRVQATGAQSDGGPGFDRMFVVVFDDGVIKFSGFFDVPIGQTVILNFSPFSYPDPTIGQGAPGIGVYIFTQQPFTPGTHLDRVDPLLVDEETNCQALVPLVDLRVEPTSVAPGQQVNLIWSAQRTQGNLPCSPFLGQGTTWQEINLRPAVGVQALNAPMTPGTVVFGLECQGVGGRLGQAQVTLTVTGGGGGGGGGGIVTVDLNANPGRTSPGGVINLEWTSNAPMGGRPCLPLAGGTTRWSNLGMLPANGRRSIAAPPNVGQVDFLLQCSNGSASGNDLTSVTVVSSAPPPRPRQAGVTSLTAAGNTAAGTSNRPSIVRDGSALIFETTAANIAAILPNGQPHVDNNGLRDIFLITSAQAVTGNEVIAKGGPPQAVLCSIGENNQPLPIGTFNPRVAATGAGATFESSDGQIRTFDGGLGRTRGSTSSSAAGVAGNGVSANPSISADAGRVAFDSTATNLVTMDANGPMPDVFLKDPVGGGIELISVGIGGAPANGPSINPAVSGDGLTVFFQTEATNMTGLPAASVPSAKGGVSQICGVQNSGGLGRTRGCVSIDTITGTPGNGPSRNVAMNQTGEFGVFESDASNLVAGDTNGVTDVFWFSWNGTEVTGVVRVSVGPNGEQANGPSRAPSISDDGLTVAFESDATNLVPPDTNGQTDAFIKYVQTGQIQRFSSTATGAEPNGPVSQVVVSGDGSTVAFSSGADNIIPGDVNDRPDVFVAPSPQVIDAFEPALIGAPLPAPNPPNEFCSSGFFIAQVDDGPAPGVQPGIFALELLLDSPGTRILAGGLNFGGLTDVSQVGFAGFNIANAANEDQRVDISLTGSSTANPTGNFPVRVTINRRTQTTTTQVFQTVTSINLTTPFVTSLIVPPGFYEATVAPEGFPPEAAGGEPEGQFFFSLASNFVDRPGGGFQGGTVAGGYHAENPFGGVSGFVGFCLGTPHSTSLQVRSMPTYGSSGAGDLRIQVLDGPRNVIYSVP